MLDGGPCTWEICSRQHIKTQKKKNKNSTINKNLIINSVENILQIYDDICWAKKNIKKYKKRILVLFSPF